MEQLTKSYWVKKLDLFPHPEGGFYKQTFCSENNVIIADKNDIPRSAGTDIYYLLGSPVIGDFSAWHRLNNLEESWHYHYGKNIIIYMIDAQGNFSENYLGLLGSEKAKLQIHIPANTWFCAVLDSENPEDYALAGCTVHPGFDYKDFQLADRDTLSKEFPQYKDIIEKYTRITVSI